MSQGQSNASKWLIYHFTRGPQGQVLLAGAPVNKFTNFPIYSLEGAIKCQTSIGIGTLHCICENMNGTLRIAWTEDKGMQRLP
jgi:hypothetical protein